MEDKQTEFTKSQPQGLTPREGNDSYDVMKNAHDHILDIDKDPQGSGQGPIPRMVMGQKPPTIAELRKRFFYHPPRDQQAVRNHEAVSLLMFELAKELCAICPPGRNLSLALTALEEVRMRANAAIAVDDPRD